MTALPSDYWFHVFPGPRIPDVLAYVCGTWDWLLHTFGETVTFDHDEPSLTDSLCYALSDQDRRYAHKMDCDFLCENWELRRGADQRVTRVARTDILVILGARGTPHLVLEFKKLDGSANDRWRYCFDGMNRFVEGKYAVGHVFGVMCGFSPNNLPAEEKALGAYITQPDYVSRLSSVPDVNGNLVVAPSPTAPASARFDTKHQRPSLTPDDAITLLHTLLPCPPGGARELGPPQSRNEVGKRKGRSSGVRKKVA